MIEYVKLCMWMIEWNEKELHVRWTVFSKEEKELHWDDFWWVSGVNVYILWRRMWNDWRVRYDKECVFVCGKWKLINEDEWKEMHVRCCCDGFLNEMDKEVLLRSYKLGRMWWWDTSLFFFYRKSQGKFVNRCWLAVFSCLNCMFSTVAGCINRSFLRRAHS